jgi:hypothetical protein
MDRPKVYRELGVWIAEWPDGTFLTADDTTELQRRIDAFAAAGCQLSRSHADAYAIAAACLVGGLIVLGVCAVAGAL